MTNRSDVQDAAMPADKPLAGIRVADFTSMLAGPYCARWFADLGADVIKIESLDGDYMRTTAPLRDGRSAYFAHLNAGKRSIAVDLKTAAGIRIVSDLVAASDVLLENFRPGVMQRFGLDAEAVRCTNPGLVYCSISGYGQTGPGAAQPAYAAMVHAASGFDLATMEAQAGAVEPQSCGVQIADVLAAVFACSAVQIALLHRARTGLGQSIDLSLFDGMLALLPSHFQQMQFAVPAGARPNYKPLPTLDGFVAIMPLSQANFMSMCKAMGHAEWAADPLFATGAARFRNWGLLLEHMAGWTSRRTAAECETILQVGGVPAARFRTLVDAVAEPQTVHRQVVHGVSDGSGPLDVVGLPFRLSSGPTAPGQRVPDLGEDTEQVLRDVLDMGAADIANLIEAKVIGSRPRQHAS